jgi:hypothetical protein
LYFSVATLITFADYMRIAVFFLFLFFHLLGGGNVVHAASHGTDSARHLQAFFSNKNQVKSIKSVPNVMLLTAAEFDLEEESTSKDSFESTNTAITYREHHLSHAWYLNFSCQSLRNHYYKNFKIFALSCGQSNPLYILQRVLRI